jgi:hypothetical protein
LPTLHMTFGQPFLLQQLSSPAPLLLLHAIMAVMLLQHLQLTTDAG